MKLPKLPKLPVPGVDWPSVQIGEFYVGPLEDGDYWIEHRSGEGMHVRKATMEKLISDFYREKF